MPDTTHKPQRNSEERKLKLASRRAHQKMRDRPCLNVVAKYRPKAGLPGGARRRALRMKKEP